MSQATLAIQPQMRAKVHGCAEIVRKQSKAFDHGFQDLISSIRVTRNPWSRWSRQNDLLTGLRVLVISESTDPKEMQTLSPVQQKFILHWGEMGTRWGINRTVAQIHALLFISSEPLNADQIVEVLDVARSNVSNSLKELQGWGIVKLVHIMGEKRDHFESMKEPWEMFRVVLDERKRREIDPTVALLKDCIAEAEKDKETDKYTEARLRALHEFFSTTTSWYMQIRQWPTSAVVKFVRLGDKVLKLLNLTG